MLQVHRIADPRSPFKPSTYDILLPDTVPTMRDIYPLVRRVLVSSAHAENILRCLASAGVSGGSVFPGLWGVAREIEEGQWLANVKSPIELSPLAERLENEMLALRKK